LFAEHEGVRTIADKVVALGRVVGLLGVVLVLLLIGGLKFTQVEIEGLKPIIEPTPWLAWMYPAFGEAGASYLLGVIELATALLLMLSPWSVRAGFVGGVLATLTFFVTTTIMFAAPIWETASGGFPFLVKALQGGDRRRTSEASLPPWRRRRIRAEDGGCRAYPLRKHLNCQNCQGQVLRSRKLSEYRHKQ
jgi:uncharacterized membrane protein YkgB